VGTQHLRHWEIQKGLDRDVASIVPGVGFEICHEQANCVRGGHQREGDVQDFEHALGQLHQICSMKPCSAQSSVFERKHGTHGNEQGVALVSAGVGFGKGAEPGIAVVEEVDQVALDIVQTRRQALVFDNALERNCGQWISTDVTTATLLSP